MSWEALGRDPVPGDPAAVEGLAGRFEAVRDGAEAVSGRLRAVDGGTGPDAWTGPAADAFRDLLAEAGPHVGKLADAHDRAAGALRVYATALDAAQADARRAETDAERATADRAAAQGRQQQADADAATWTRTADDARQRLAQGQAQRATAADPVYAAQLDTYLQTTTAQHDHARSVAADLQSRSAAAGRDATAAGDRLTAATTAADRAAHDRDDAARRLVGVLRSATPSESLWNRLVRDVEQFFDLTGGAPQPDAPQQGHTTPRRKHWWDSALDTLGDAGAAVYNTTVVPVVNAAADVGQAAVEHPEDLAGMLLGGGMMALGGAGEIGGVALDLTGIGVVVGVPLDVVSAGVVAAGAGVATMSAGDLGRNAAQNNHQVLGKARGPSASRGQPGDPLPESGRPDTAGADWQGRVSVNGKGEVWQKPENVNAPKGTPKNANSIRIMDPEPRYPNGYVRFYNEQGQPMQLDGTDGPDKSTATHFEIRPDGSYDIPRGWNP